MSHGYVQACIPKQFITFPNLAVGVTQEIILADMVDALQWRELTLMVKVHSHSVSGSNSINIGAYGQSVSADDPGVTFIDRSDFANNFITSSTPSPTYFTIPLLGGDGAFAGMPPMVRIAARATQGSAGLISATLSVDLSVKDA